MQDWKQMQTRARDRPRYGRSEMWVSGGGYRSRRRWPWALLILGAAVLAALAFAYVAWPRGALMADDAALARVNRPSFGTAGVRVSARSADGTPIPVSLHRDGRIWPRRRLAPGARISVEVDFRRPGWVGWVAGRTQHLRLQLRAPQARVEQHWLRVPAGEPVRVSFDRPVRQVRLAGVPGPRLRVLSRPRRRVVLGRLGEAGSVAVSAVARTWEKLPPPTSVSWFPAGGGPKLISTPKPSAQLGPGTAIRLRFSEPVATLLHGHAPSFSEPVSGAWRTLDAHTLLFQPRGYGFGLDRAIHLQLPVAVEQIGDAGPPASTLAWTTPVASELRLQQLLAQLGYLPLSWSATGRDPATPEAEVAAAVTPPRGTFTWRYPNIPGELQANWTAGTPNQITRGAVMMFEDTHGLEVDALAGPRVWQALIADAIAGRRRTDGYSYVYVHRAVPQSLNLWHEGQVILSSPGNTGVPAAPTQLGTFPVFEHIPIGTMSGTNPDGSHYNDPGIRYISYFNAGDAIHAFNRASFGTPQSLGCVELPLDAAAKVWPYTPIGTLVTIEN